MSALALALFLVVFYFIPVRGLPLYEWVWRDAPERLPGLVLHYHGAVRFNGAYYAEMLGGWLACLLIAALLRWAAPRDDPGWEGLFRGFGRRAALGLTDVLLTVALVAVVVWCAVNGRAAHGPLCAGTAVIATLIAAPAFSWLRLTRRLGRARTASDGVAQASGSEPEAAPSLEARPLREDEPLPIHKDAVVMYALSAAAHMGMGAPPRSPHAAFTLDGVDDAKLP